MPGNGTAAENLQQELNNSSQDGFSLNQTVFYSTSPSQCSRQQITGCDNNEPSQFICVNSQYANLVMSQYHLIYSRPTICPEFYAAGDLSCGTVQNYCVVLNSRQTIPAQPNSSG